MIANVWVTKTAAIWALAVAAFALQAAVPSTADRAVAAEVPPDAGHKPKVLEGLPSPSGPHVAVLKALAEGAWADLGPPAADPVWGVARGRSWTANMAYAATLDGAFLYGEGVHGWFNPDSGRYMDDLWFYDVAGHRWITLYPGTSVTGPPLLELDEDGFLSHAEAGNLPLASMVHGYQMTAWDAAAQRLASMPCPGRYWREAMPHLRDQYEHVQPRLNRRNASPWWYDPGQGHWQRQRTVSTSPKSGFGDTLIYLDSIQQLLFRHRDQAWLYDSQSADWRELQPSGPPPPFGIEAVAAYDGKRNRVYIGGGRFPDPPGANLLWAYDVANNQWLDLAPAGSAGGKVFNVNTAMLHYDAAADLVLLFRYQKSDGGGQRGIYAYDPEANQWLAVAADLPAFWPAGFEANGSSGFYHPGHDVHLFHVAGDSRDNGRVIAYRHRR